MTFNKSHKANIFKGSQTQTESAIHWGMKFIESDNCAEMGGI